MVIILEGDYFKGGDTFQYVPNCEKNNCRKYIGY